ncbi:MAG: NifU family protein [Erysipelotrichaceae bacterium]|nr:NifU family protein [Erysipelotrichaceae bacterium]
MEQQIIEVLEKIRPFLQKDGGDIEFVSFKDGIVYVKMSGACADCIYIDDTIKDGVEAMLLDEVPGVISVEVVKE